MNEIVEMEYGPSLNGYAQVLAHGKYDAYEYYILSGGTHPCGYVVIPKDHPLYEKSTDYLDSCMRTYKGFTYSGPMDFHNQDGERIQTDWAIGWDYMHIGDFVFGMFEGIKHSTNEMIDDAKYVIDQLNNKDD